MTCTLLFRNLNNFETSEWTKQVWKFPLSFFWVLTKHSFRWTVTDSVGGLSKSRGYEVCDCLVRGQKEKAQRGTVVQGSILVQLVIIRVLIEIIDKLCKSDLWNQSSLKHPSCLNTYKPLNSLSSAVNMEQCKSNWWQSENANLLKDFKESKSNIRK